MEAIDKLCFIAMGTILEFISLINLDAMITKQKEGIPNSICSLDT